MQRLSAAFYFLLLLTSASAWSQDRSRAGCDMPTDIITPYAPLSRVSVALAKTSSLAVLAIGSGSTVGKRSSLNEPNTGTSFPYRMAEALQSLRPNLKVNLTVKGGRSMTADMMLPLLRRELSAHHYDLVIWQTGTVEAVHGVRPDIFASTLQDGADAVEYAHADLVLIDPQFSRFLRANVDLSPYETVLAQTATMQAVTLFRRFDLTKYWVTSGQLDLERVSREQRDKTIASLSDCLGRALARYVLAGTSNQ